MLSIPVKDAVNILTHEICEFLSQSPGCLQNICITIMPNYANSEEVSSLYALYTMTFIAVMVIPNPFLEIFCRCSRQSVRIWVQKWWTTQDKARDSRIKYCIHWCMLFWPTPNELYFRKYKSKNIISSYCTWALNSLNINCNVNKNEHK